MQAIRDAIRAALEIDQPMTARQVFYRLAVPGIVGKTEAEYKGTVCRLLAEMRLDGQIPFSWITDNIRWVRKPITHSGLQDMLELSSRTYRQALWASQGSYVEVWLEKDALAGVVAQETEPYDVPLMVTRGYASLSFLHSAAEAIAEIGKPTFIYYIGDHDPSGVDIPRQVERRLREFAPKAEIHFERLAVNPDQIATYQLPTRPTKQTDSRIRQFTGRSVEVDAIPPRDLRNLVKEAIEQHLDFHALWQQEREEQTAREALAEMAVHWGSWGASA